MADILETIKQLVRAGASSEEIVETLKGMGIEEDEARRLILLAERDMLRVLRNEIREIARDAFREEYERMKEDVNALFAKKFEEWGKITEKRLKSMLNDALGKYVSELSRVEERVDLLERKMYDLELAVARSGRIKIKRKKPIGFVLLFSGIALAFLTLFYRPEGIIGYLLLVLAVALLIGGAVLG